MMYLRFVAGIESESATKQHGLFTEIQYLKDDKLLLDYQYELVKEVFEYFNKNLPVPPYKKKNISKSGVAWFKDSATSFISRMWDLVAILEQNEINVRVMKIEKPGMSLYEDDFQVVAKSKLY